MSAIEKVKKLTMVNGTVKEKLVGYEDIKIYGAVTFHEECDSKKLSLWGRGKFLANTKANYLTNHGASSFYTVEAGKLMNKGSLTLEEGIATTLTSMGHLSVKQAMNAERIRLTGVIKANTLKAERIEIRNTGKSNVNTLQGNYITTSVEKKSLSLSGKKLTCSAIFGEEIHLRSTYAQSVKGTNVYIGPKCYIEELVYADSYTIDPTSTVNNIIKEQGDSDLHFK